MLIHKRYQDLINFMWRRWSSRYLLLLADHRRQRARNFENSLAGAAHGTELAEDGQTDGADESDVDQLPMAETGCAVVDLGGRGQAKLTPAKTRIGKECPEQELKQAIQLVHPDVLSVGHVCALLQQP